jgi:hypothetical protein
MQKLKYQDIFVPGGFPQHTYNPRLELRLEQKLSEANDNLCKLVTVTGQTKSGKTVLARKIFPTENSIWIDGGTVSSEDDFWQVAIQELSVFQGTSELSSNANASRIGAKVSGAASLLVVKGSGEFSVGINQTKTAAQTSTRTLSSRITALTGLRNRRIPLIVDDFHYIPREMQGSIVRALKPLVFDGLPVVIIAIPHRRYDAIKVEKEMTGRISHIEIHTWSSKELIFIPEEGFGLLNYSLPTPTKERLAAEAIGSPHLMQDFCREICKLRDLKCANTNLVLQVTTSEIDSVFHEVAETIGRPIFEKLARGPRQRTDRVPRQIKDGRTVDIYELVLHALAHLRPSLVSIEYEDLRGAIREVSDSQIPQLHEIARVLKHMATIAASDQSSTPVIDFEDQEKKLHVTDPFFAFYLRWGELTRT